MEEIKFEVGVNDFVDYIREQWGTDSNEYDDFILLYVDLFKETGIVIYAEIVHALIFYAELDVKVSSYGK